MHGLPTKQNCTKTDPQKVLGQCETISEQLCIRRELSVIPIVKSSSYICNTVEAL